MVMATSQKGGIFMFHSKYGEIAKMCRESGQPVYITTDGDEELAVMDIRSFQRLQRTLRVKEELLNALMRKLSSLKFADADVEEA